MYRVGHYLVWYRAIEMYKKYSKKKKKKNLASSIKVSTQNTNKVKKPISSNS